MATSSQITFINSIPAWVWMASNLTHRRNGLACQASERVPKSKEKDRDHKTAQIARLQRDHEADLSRLNSENEVKAKVRFQRFEQKRSQFQHFWGLIDGRAKAGRESRRRSIGVLQRMLDQSKGFFRSIMESIESQDEFDYEEQLANLMDSSLDALQDDNDAHVAIMHEMQSLRLVAGDKLFVFLNQAEALMEEQRQATYSVIQGGPGLGAMSPEQISAIQSILEDLGDKVRRKLEEVMSEMRAELAGYEI